MRLGGTVVLDEDDGGVRTDGQFADETIMGAGVAEDPAAAVDVQNRGKGRRRPRRFDDARLNVADVGGNAHPLLVDVGLVDRCGLDVVEDFPCALGPELVEERGLRGRLGKLLRRWFKDVLWSCGTPRGGGSRRDGVTRWLSAKTGPDSAL